MKIIFFLSFFFSSIVLLLGGCKSSYKLKYKRALKFSYVDGFKKIYFAEILRNGFNKKPEIDKILIIDGGIYAEGLLSEKDLDIIDSLVKIDNKQLYQDSIYRIGRVAEGGQGKHAIAYALSKYESKWLDSLAKARSKIYMKNLKLEE